MNETKTLIKEQLGQLQMLMHRVSFHGFKGGMHNPHRGQGRVLTILKMKPEISQKELGYLLNISKQALAELISKLEKNGYITREHSEEDKRAMIVMLTEKGEKAIDGDNKICQTSKAFDCLNDEELSTFSEYLGRIIKNYEDQFPDEDFEQRRKMMKKFMSSYGAADGHGHDLSFCCGFKGRGHRHRGG